MKDKYIKPEVISQDFSLQIFLANCHEANQGNGFFADYGFSPCWDPGTFCDPCEYPIRKPSSNMG